MSVHHVNNYKTCVSQQKSNISWSKHNIDRYSYNTSSRYARPHTPSHNPVISTLKYFRSPNNPLNFKRAWLWLFDEPPCKVRPHATLDCSRPRDRTAKMAMASSSQGIQRLLRLLSEESPLNMCRVIRRARPLFQTLPFAVRVLK